MHNFLDESGLRKKLVGSFVDSGEATLVEPNEKEKAQAELPAGAKAMYERFINGNEVNLLVRSVLGMETASFGRRLTSYQEAKAIVLGRFERIKEDFLNSTSGDEEKGSGDLIQFENDLQEIRNQMALTVAGATETAMKINEKLHTVSEKLKLHPEVRMALFRPQAFEVFMDREISKDEQIAKQLSSAQAVHEHLRSPKLVTSHGIEILIGQLEEEARFSEEDYAEVLQVEGAGTEMAEKLKAQAEQKRKEYGPILAELKAILKFQQNFERQVQSIVVDSSAGELPKNFFEDVESRANSLEAEDVPSREPLYFPVGISKDLEKWQQVFNGELNAEKPIDIYAYLFWLNNQGKEVVLVVADEAQVPNYTTAYAKKYEAAGDDRYKLSEEKAGEWARKIGEVEAEKYRLIISAYGLTNLKVVQYREFVDRNRESFEDYQQIIERLSEHPLFKDMCEKMLQGSVDKNASAEEKRKYLNYALEELAVILSARGTKFSHQNEARYDVLAEVIEQIEKQFPEKNRMEIFSAEYLQSKEFLEAYDTAVASLQLFFQKKMEGEGEGEAKTYFAKSFEVTKGLRESEKKYAVTVFAGDKKGQQELMNRGSVYKKFAQGIRFTFAVPKAGARSFGWKTSRGGGEEAVVGFKEPYSTYFHKDGAGIFLNSDQVVATSDGFAAGKVLALNKEKQVQYAQEVLKPLLVQFIKTLDNAPREYFDNIHKTREELVTEAKNLGSNIEAVLYIQRYIVAPAHAK